MLELVAGTFSQPAITEPRNEIPLLHSRRSQLPQQSLRLLGILPWEGVQPHPTV